MSDPFVIQPIDDGLQSIAPVPQSPSYQPSVSTQQSAPISSIQPSSSTQPSPIDTLLIKGQNETDQMFNYRSAYTRRIISKFGTNVDLVYSVTLGFIAANKYLLGVVYDVEVEKIYKFINDELNK